MPDSTIDRLRLTALVAACLVAGACNNSATSVPADLGPAPPDLSCVTAACVAEKDEDCFGCMRHIGQCCYQDEAWTSTPVLVNTLANTCSDIASCAACCNECLAMPCAELVKRGNCPYGP